MSERGLEGFARHAVEVAAAVDFAMLTLDAHHSQYVDRGASTRNPENAAELTIGRLVMVFDREGWATLHKVVRVSRAPFVHDISFGGRVAWPDGSVAARKAPADAWGESGDPT